MTCDSCGENDTGDVVLCQKHAAVDELIGILKPLTNEIAAVAFGEIWI